MLTVVAWFRPEWTQRVSLNGAEHDGLTLASALQQLKKAVATIQNKFHAFSLDDIMSPAISSLFIIILSISTSHISSKLKME